MNPATTDRYWQVPTLATRDRMVAGVAGGIAEELGLGAVWVRLAFVALFAAGGWGALLYLLLWGWISYEAYRQTTPVVERVPKGRNARERIVGFVIVTFGVFGLFEQLFGLPNSLVWPLGLLGAGLVVLWLRVGTARNGSLRPGHVFDRPLVVAQVVGGMLLVVVGAVLLARPLSGSTQGSVGLAIGVGGGLGLLALSAPWWWRLLADLDAERQARVRSEERADVAAHLHDSVLQTLTLIQRHSDDPQKMVGLARRQERELRNWLDPDRVSREGASVRGQLDELVSDVEDLHGLTIDVVVVGDCLVDPAIDSLLAAVREAVVNGAKHAGVAKIDVYVEIRPDRIEAFVRDEGVGFEPSTIAADRQGIRHSIEQRMQRVGGSATIISAPGEGTEVELNLPRVPGPHQETAS